MTPDEVIVPKQVGDEGRPNTARMYDYFLGGAHHFATDRALADQMISRSVRVVTQAWDNRACLGRMVRHCITRLGITQFLDLGCGIPVIGAVHDVAHALVPDARVAYVDHDPVVVAHARDILVGQRTITVTHADLRDPRAVLGAPRVAGLLDLDRPVAVLALAVLHFVPDADDPGGLITDYRSALVPGSAFALTHAAADTDGPEAMGTAGTVTDLYARSTDRASPRTRGAIAALLRGLDLVPPGLVDIVDWRPDGFAWPATAPAAGYAALGTTGRHGGPV